MAHLDPVVEHSLAALLATSILGTALAVFYWLMTGLSPWPFVIIGEIGGFGFGTLQWRSCLPGAHASDLWVGSSHSLPTY